MDSWSTILGQRTMESINAIAHDTANIPTLRDQFAIAALNGRMACPGWEIDDYDELAEWSYKIADAMVEARKKNR